MTRDGSVKKIFLLCVALWLPACTHHLNDNEYGAGEVGISRAVEFGTVINVRPVTVTADKRDEDVGTLVGAGAGFGGGSYVGGGSGNTWAQAGGTIAGAIIGDQISREIMKDNGFEYTLQMRNGEVKTIVRRKSDDNHEFKVGDKVMLQYCDAGNEHVKRCKANETYQRLLPIDKFPLEVKKKKRSHKKKSNDDDDDSNPDNQQ